MHAWRAFTHLPFYHYDMVIGTCVVYVNQINACEIEKLRKESLQLFKMEQRYGDYELDDEEDEEEWS